MNRGFYGQQPAYQQISPKEAQAMLESSDAMMIDVREPHEYQQVHAKGVKLIPLATVPDNLSEIPQDKTVLVICHSGGRSAYACDILLGAGYDKAKVYNVMGGTAEWEYAGLPTEQG